MDLSHLVSCGLFAAKKAPLTEAQQAYFAKYGLEKALSDIVEQLAKNQPQDPYAFIAQEVSKLSTGGKAVSQPPAAVKAAPPKKEETKAPAAAEKKVEKPAEKQKASAEVDDAAVEKIKEDLKKLKEKLKSEGLTGQKLNAHADVVALVAEMNRLKEGGSGTAAAPKKEPAPAPKAAPKEGGKKADKKPDAKKAEVAKKEDPSKGGGMSIKKADDVPGWYEQVIKKAELINDYPVKGCFILRPWAYRIWELIQRWFDAEIKKMGVDNCYFPMFIPKCYIEKEEDHLSDFAPELAWVSKFGDQEIDEPVAIRPTSETAMYAAYSNWVQSHRDLPIKLNQWCSVVRWEVKQTTPFLRTREFLWQEGHTAHASAKDAKAEVREILELYALVYEYLLALPVVRGTKTKAETFPGADYTTTVEAFIPITGRAIQGATSHYLGQNFSKMFEISFQDPNDPTGKARDHAYQNSWGITQRTIGVMTMVHGDDKGLVLPPRVACFQVVIVVVGMNAKTTPAEKEKVEGRASEYALKLRDAGLRVELDDRDGYSPGYKFNHWEMKGVPLRLEFGLKDMDKDEFVMVKRNDGQKVPGKHERLVDDVKDMLETIQQEMYDGAVKERDEKIASINTWEEFSPNLNMGKLVLVPFCGVPSCEEAIKEKTKEEAADVEVIGGLKMGAKSLCVPIEDKYNVNCPPVCIRPGCGGKAERRTLFGRSY
jgi:bifunctional glutamyl/prolyl-tRNA synthetase